MLDKSSKWLKRTFARHFFPYTYKTLKENNNSDTLTDLVNFLEKQPKQNPMENYWAVFKNSNVDFSFIEWAVSKATKNYTQKLTTVDYFSLLENPNITPQMLDKLLILNGPILNWTPKTSHLLNTKLLEVILKHEKNNSLMFMFGAITKNKFILTDTAALFIAENMSLKNEGLFAEIFLSSTENKKVMEKVAERVLLSSLDKTYLTWFRSLSLNPHLHFSVVISKAFNKTGTVFSMTSQNLEPNSFEKIQAVFKYMMYDHPQNSANPEIVGGSPSIRWENFDVETLMFAGLHFSDENNFHVRGFKNVAIQKMNAVSWEECLSKYLSEITGDDCSMLPHDWVKSLLQELTVK